MADAIRAGGVLVDVRANLHTITPDLARAKSASERTGRAMANEFSKAEKKALTLTKAVTALGGGMALLGAGFTLGNSIGILADFSAAMKEVAALTGATGKQFKELETQARALGASTKFSATAAAEAQGFLARAGYDVNEVLTATPQVLTLAAAGGLELASAADIASNVLAGFNLEVAETGRVVDLLAKTANSSNSTVSQLGEALKYAAPSAVAFGVSVEETLSAIGKLQDAGIQGGLAGRGLVSFSSALVAKKDELTELIGEYDIATDGLQGVIEKINSANLSIEDSVKLFRAENLDILTVLRNAVSNGTFKDLELGLKGSAGYAKALAETKVDQLKGDIQALASAAQEVVLAMGEEGLTGGLRAIVQTATGAFRGLSENMGSVTKAAEVLAFILAATLARKGIGSVASNLVILQGQLAGSTVGMTRMAAASTLAANAARGMWAAITGPAGLAIIAGLALGLAKVGTDAQTAESRISSLNKTLSSLDTVNAKIAEDTTTLKTLNDQLAEAMESQSDIAASTATTEIDAINKRIAKNKELQQVYKAQAVIELAKARQAVSNEGGNLSYSVGRAIGATERYDDARTGTSRTRTRSASEAEVSAYFKDLQRAAATGDELTKKQVKQLEQYVDLLEARNQIEAQSAIIEAIDNPVAVKAPEKVGETKKASGGSGGTSEEAKYERDKLAALEAQHALRLAIIKDEQDLIEQLERAEEIERLTAEYAEAGLKIDEARAKATAQVNEARDLELKITEQELEEKRALHDLEAQIDKARAAKDIEREAALRTELDILKEINDLKKLGVTGDLRAIATDNVVATTADDLKRRDTDDESNWENFGEDAADAFKYGLKTAIQDGDWGEAFGEVLSGILDNAFSNAMDDLFDAISKIDWTGNGGTGWGGLISSIGSSFGGGKAAGGRVKAGTSYTIGELGPERFVPDVNGSIVSNKDMTGGRSGDLSMRSGATNVNVVVNGNMDNVTKADLGTAITAAISKAVPPMVDQRVTDRKMRGAY